MKQNVDVVFRSPNRERNHAVILGNPREVGPQAGLKFRRDGFAAIFGAEDHMDVVPRKCVCQMCRPFRGLCYLTMGAHRCRGGLRCFVPDGTAAYAWG